MTSEPLGTISFLVVFILGLWVLVKKWKKERNEPRPQVRLVRVRQGRRFSVVEPDPEKVGKTEVRLGKSTIWVDDSLLTEKEDE